jgi:serine/threonine-protein kinase
MGFSAGDLIGDYEVIGELGSGGMGTVFKVRHVISQRVEALKLLHREPSGDLQANERFLREIRVLASFSHPNIASLHTAIRAGSQLAMIMEFVDGASLRDEVRAGRVNIRQAVDYMTQVAAALDYAHGRGVIHRDLKSTNVMVTPEQTVKLLDFGIAKSTAELMLTRPGRVLGSLNYMSPEQIRGERADARSDIYAAGVTLYEAVTGRLPIEAETEYAVMTGHLFRDPEPPANVNPNVPENLSDVIMTALAKDPDQRFSSAAAFGRALANIFPQPADPHLPEIERLTVPSAPVPRSMAASIPTHGSGSGSAITTSVLDEISRQLAGYIGPIAKIVVQRAAGRCHTAGDLCSAVAQEIDSPSDRQAFLDATRRTRA